MGSHWVKYDAHRLSTLTPHDSSKSALILAGVSLWRRMGRKRRAELQKGRRNVCLWHFSDIPDRGMMSGFGIEADFRLDREATEHRSTPKKLYDA
jgi:hypothetical protein